TWSFFGEIDEVAKASGIVRPNEKVSNIQSTVLGTVESYHVKEGQWVEAGDLLMSLEHESLKLDLTSNQRELARLEQDVELLKRYRDSVEGHINLFQEKDEAEKVYYHLVEQYLLEYAQKELQYHSSIEQLKQATGESLLAKEGITLNQRATSKKNNQSIADYNRQIEELEKELSGEQQLKLSMEAENNQLPASDMLRAERHNQYMLTLRELQAALSESEKKVEQTIALGKRFVPASQLEAERLQVEAAKLQLTQFQQEALQGVQSQ